MKDSVKNITGIKTIFLILVLLFSFLLSGCQGGNLDLSVARKEALKYLKAKYGISAKITSADSNSHSDSFGFTVWEDSATIKMKEGNKYFIVQVELLPDGTCKCKDNYQQYDIKMALKKAFDDEIRSIW